MKTTQEQLDILQSYKSALEQVMSVAQQYLDVQSQHRALQNLLHAEFKKLGYDPNQFDDWADGFNGLECRIRALSSALRDAISTYGPQAEIIVTEERQEAWQSVLKANGI